MKHVLIAVLLFSSACACAQNGAKPAAKAQPCSQAELKQFDFWVGEWDAYYQAPGGAKLKASNSVKRTLDGCAVEENFLDDPAANPSAQLKGRSLSTFDRQSKKWKQTWVDSTGAYLDFTGEFKDGRMVLQRSATVPNGLPVQQRMTYRNISSNEFDWDWEISRDSGKTWAMAWQLHYVRKQTKAANVSHGESCDSLIAWTPLPAAWLRYFLLASCN